MKGNDTMKYYWHIHHEILMEGSENIEERIKYIKSSKPDSEIELRLRLLKEVKGELPQAYRDAEKAYRDAGKAYPAAGKAYLDADRAHLDADRAYRDAEKAYRDADKAYRDADKAWRDADKAHRAADKAWRDAGRAYLDADKAYQAEIEALHKIECPDCPWNGFTILPARKS